MKLGINLSHDSGESHLWGLTFELSGRRRQDARPGHRKMYTVPCGRAWWPAVGAPLERGVRHHYGNCAAALYDGRSTHAASQRETAG